MGISKTNDHIQLMIKIPTPSQEPPASPKAPNEDLKEMDVLCTFEIKLESHNLYLNQGKDVKPQPGTSRILQSPKSGLKGYGCSLHL